MTKQRFFRFLLCFLVVCCLVINMSPIRAEATSVVVPATGVVAAVPGLNVIAAGLIGLGVCYGLATTDWDSIASRCESYLVNQGIIDHNGNLNVFKVPDENGGLSKWFADLALVEMIRAWLFDEEIVTETVGQEGWFYYNEALLPEIPSFDSAFKYITITRSPDVSDWYYVNVSTWRPYYCSDTCLNNASSGASRSAFLVLSDGYWKNISTSDSSVNYSDRCLISDRLYVWSNYDVYDKSMTTLYYPASDPISAASSFDSSYDVSLGEVAASDTAIADGYTTWAEGAISVPGSQVGSEEEEIPYFPIGIGQTYEETRDLAQTDVWAGTSTYEDTTTDEDTNSGTITDTWSPPADPGAFALDLTKFFPFCIPFDLYDFLTCLNADPVAPVISWELPLPGGSTFPIEIDLSPFDSVAQLLRRLELLLFIVGLAIKTRDLIKG